MTVYLLDASTLISANRTWFALKRVPEFWTWIVHHAANGAIKMPTEIYGEVEAGTDTLASWMRISEHRNVLRLNEAVSFTKVQSVLSFYGDLLSETDVVKIGQDPFLVAAAMGYPDRCVVTAETSSPKKTKANRKVPDICNDAGVTPVQLLEQLDFTTSWDEP